VPACKMLLLSAFSWSGLALQIVLALILCSLQFEGVPESLAEHHLSCHALVSHPIDRCMACFLTDGVLR
jgi:hypothetical protein